MALTIGAGTVETVDPQELITEQMRLDQAWERHLMPRQPSSERMTDGGPI
jgi:hypothetical protein